MTKELTVADFIDVPMLQNVTARMVFLLDRMLKDAKELKELGIEMNIDALQATTNDRDFPRFNKRSQIGNYK